MLDRLVRKFIIEPQGNLFTLSAPIAEYITECYRGLGYKNIAEKKSDKLPDRSLFKSTEIIPTNTLSRAIGC
jgi:hypothetical protein